MTDDAAPAETTPAETATEPSDALDGGAAELLGLIDRLAELLNRSDLTELEIESGGTGLVLRKSVGPVAPLVSASTSAAEMAPPVNGASPPASPPQRAANRPCRSRRQSRRHSPGS